MGFSTWLGWVWTGLQVALVSVIAVSVLAALTLEPPDPYDDGFGQLAMLAIGVVAGLSSLAVSVLLMPLVITICEECFQKRTSILVSGGVVAAIALPWWIWENFHPDVLFFAAGPFFSAILMAIIAHTRTSDGA